MQLYFLPPCITCDKVHASDVHGIGNNWDPIGKGKGLNTCYSAAYMSQTHDQQAAALYNLGRGSWLAWANGAAAHYVAIHCPH